MRSAIALCLALSLTACASKSTRLEPIPCAPLPEAPATDTLDDWLIYLSRVIELYGECALRR